MLKHKRESIEWLEFELFQEFSQVEHAIFLRHGGVSATPYHTLNMGGGTGDHEHNIRVNRSRIQKVLSCSQLIGGHQVHGATVLEVPLTQADEKCDGLLTSKRDIGLMIKHADCQAALIYDPTLHVIGNIHAGWKGNVQNIYLEAVKQLKKRYGCKVENLFVGISPSLGPCCAQFINYRTELPISFWDYQIKFLYFDLWEISRQQLIQAGILPHHIQIAGICNYCNPDDYFSYRRDKPTGRHAMVISLKKQTTQ